MSRVPIRLPAKSKYRAVRTNGYASKREAERARQLENLVGAGVIKNLCKQPMFQLIKSPDGKRRGEIWYVADFSYWDIAKDVLIVEDVKGFKTPVYRLKKKMMASIWGIKIHEV